MFGQTEWRLPRFRWVAFVLVPYVAAYLLLRWVHFIRCYSNAWNWMPEKWDLRHQFVDSSVQPWGVIFQPLMAAEVIVRVPTAVLAYFAPQCMIVGGFAVVASCIAGMFWYLPRRS